MALFRSTMQKLYVRTSGPDLAATQPVIALWQFGEQSNSNISLHDASWARF